MRAARRDPVACLVAVGVIAAGFGIDPRLGGLALLVVPLFWVTPGFRQGVLTVGALSVLVIVLAPVFLDPGHHHPTRSAASAMIKNLQQALMEYHADHGAYPPSVPSHSSWPLVTYLDGDPANGGSRKMYMEFNEDTVENGMLLDPWGRQLRYRENLHRLRGVATKPELVTRDGVIDLEATNGINWRSFDLWSHGPEPDDRSGWIGNH